jgi:type III secretory pathway component EscS
MWVSLIGILSTWWFGLMLGLFIGIVDLFYNPKKSTLNLSLKAIGINLFIALFTGLIGFIYAKYFLKETPLNWNIPHTVVDVRRFVAVGTMHNFSYIGGGIGLVVAMIYKIRQLRKK